MKTRFLSFDEQKKAKENGFIFAGKTGTGKTTLLNVIFEKEIGKVEHSSKSGTSESYAYYYKLDNGKYISIIDTPGLYDTSGDKNIDNIHLQSLKRLVNKEGINIKGIFFFMNFQVSKIDESDQNALMKYCETFPVKSFWKHVMIIFSHYYGDGDNDKEDKKKEREQTDAKILIRVINKTKKICGKIINYDEIITKYFNCHSKIKSEKQKQDNINIKKEILCEMNKFCLLDPLISRIEIFSLNNIPIQENNKTYLVNIEKKGFFDLKENPIKEEEKIISKVKYDEKLEKLPTPSCSSVLFKGIKDKEGNIIHSKTENSEKDSYFIQLMKEKGIQAVITGGIGATLGACCGGIIPATIFGLAYAGMGMSIEPKDIFKTIDNTVYNAKNFICNLFK